MYHNFITFIYLFNKIYFDPDQVNGILNCKKCDERLDEPKLLPCGNSICSSCASSLKLNTGDDKCLVCSNKHKMIANSLPINIASQALFIQYKK